MAERFTSISLPGVFGSGIAERGRVSVPDMIARIRRHAEQEAAVYNAILAAADGDFRVETYTGVYVQRQREALQPGRSRKNAYGRSALSKAGVSP